MQTLILIGRFESGWLEKPSAAREVLAERKESAVLRKRKFYALAACSA